MLKLRNDIPGKLLSCAPAEVEGLLGGPTLFRLEGRQSPPLFVTALQHGNEPTGFQAVQAILRKYSGGPLPRSLWLFIANVAGATTGERIARGQSDYNRAWPGTATPDTAEAAMMREVIATVTASPLFASVDLHNNTGSNPHYAGINRLAPPFLHLAALFARTAIYFRQPAGTQSMAMAEHCPAVTLECGKAGEAAGLAHATEFLDACLHMHELPGHPMAKRDIILLKTRAVVKVKPDVAFGFEGRDEAVTFRSDLDHHNFGCLKKGELLATLDGVTALPLTAHTDDGRDIAAELFEIRGEKLLICCDIIPSMATLDIRIIGQDCLLYVMEEMEAA